MKDLIHYIFICVAVCILAISIGGCEDKELKTLVLKPDSKRYWYAKSGHDHATSACIIGSCFFSQGTSCEPGLSTDDSTIVGYTHRHDAGTQPCPCWWYVNCAYRGYVGFDVSSLKQDGIVSAILKWTPSTQYSAGGNASNAGCIAKMYRATEPWVKGKLTNGEELSWPFTGEGNSVPSEKDVSVIVRSWINGTLPNYGFFFVGPNENINEKNNNTCLTTITNMRLEVVVSVDK